jgi:hypothetical protein
MLLYFSLAEEYAVLNPRNLALFVLFRFVAAYLCSF